MLSTHTAGDTLATTVSLAAYPASEGWVLHYRLTPRDAGSQPVSFDAAASGDDFAVTVPATTTSGWTPGAYTVAAWVTLSGVRHTVSAECGQLVVLPDPAHLSPGTDTRSEAAQALAAIRAKLKGKATDAVNRYKIADRELQSYTIPELIKLERFWAEQAAQEDRAAGLRNTRGQVQRIRMQVR